MNVQTTTNPTFQHHLALGWKRLTAPPPVFADTRDGERARLLASVLLLHILLLFLLVLIFPVWATVYPQFLGLLLGGILLSGIEYRISRTIYYQAAGVGLILSWHLIVAGILFASVPDLSMSYFLCIPIFLTMLLFSARAVFWASIGNFSILILLLFLFQLDFVQLIVPLSFNWLMCSLFGVGAYLWHKDWHRLQLSESRYRSLMEASSEILVIHDAGGHILDANPAFERTVGYGIHEVLGKVATDFLLPAQRDLITQHWRKRSPLPIETQIVHRAGAILDVELFMRRHTYQGMRVYVTAARDITTQKVIDRQRRENELRYQTLLNSTTDAVFIISLEGRYLSVNQQALAMLRCTKEDLIGTHYRDIIVTDTPNPADSISRRLLQGELLPIYERRFRRKDKTEFVGEISAMLVRDADNKPLYIQSLVRDTTARRQIEEQKFELALQRAKMKILQQFIDDVSHHFRTPLTNLKTGAYLIRRTNQNPQKVSEQLEVMDKQLERLEQLLEDLLTVTRLDKEITAEFGSLRVDVNHLLTMLLAHFTSDPDHEWEFLPNKEKLEVLGDTIRLTQAVSNLLENARTYTPSGGRISVRSFRQQEMVIIEIRDTGIGIAEEDLPHIFENFYRTDAARDLDNISTGMGLPISQKIVQMHRGILRVDSEVGVGSVFQIILPQAGSLADITFEAVQQHLPQP